MSFKLCYVTAFLDIGRNDWNEFQRTFDDYFASFTPLFTAFESPIVRESNLYRIVIFIDKKYSERVRDYIQTLLFKEFIEIIPIDENFLYQNSPLWQKLERETEIMNSSQYKELMSSANRLRFPEHHNPKYTLINHAKIDLISYAMKMEQTQDCYYFCWVDFGYFAKPDRIPTYPIDLNKLDLNKINYTLINQITEQDRDISFTLLNAPERIGGFFFFGNRKNLPEYQKIYHLVHTAFQAAQIADDDQHLALQCVFYKPKLFSLHNLGGWHRALTAFQWNENVKPKPNLTEIMNRHGSDKGSGHHNYTTYYEKLFKDIRYKNLNILEIGIGTNNPEIPSSMCGTPGGYTPGSSLRGWAEYFSNSHIFGCDIDKNILFKEDRISTFFLDQTNQNSIQEQIIVPDRMYDVIIDDGLHHFPTNWNLLKQIFSKLNENGIYIIEDIGDFNPAIYEDSFLANIEFHYFIIFNEHNCSDNNIVVARWRGKPILEV